MSAGAVEHEVTFETNGLISPSVVEALENLAKALTTDDDEVVGFGHTRSNLNIGLDHLGPKGAFEPVSTGFCVGFTVTMDPNEPDTCTIKWV